MGKKTQNRICLEPSTPQGQNLSKTCSKMISIYPKLNRSKVDLNFNKWIPPNSSSKTSVSVYKASKTSTEDNSSISTSTVCNQKSKTLWVTPIGGKPSTSDNLKSMNKMSFWKPKSKCSNLKSWTWCYLCSKEPAIWVQEIKKNKIESWLTSLSRMSKSYSLKETI